MNDVVVLGGGVAGLSAALAIARSGASVAVLTKAELGASATRYAQGGVAAALADPDSPELHGADTVSAGGSLCDAEAVRVLCSEGPSRLRELMVLGAAFDTEHSHGRASPNATRLDGPPGPGGALALAREGGHSLARVVHAGGDATGLEIERALVSALVEAGVEVHEGWFAADLLTGATGVEGVVGGPPDRPSAATVEARHVVLASGGFGQLYAVTTNPAVSTGDGVAMALRAGVAVADLEFVQFHPTALHPVHSEAPGPRRLLSEALRGDGAVLRDAAGVAFMAAEHPLGDLAPRDVVALAIARRLADGGIDHLWLDATAIADFPTRFPTIWRASQAAGVDPRREWLPVAPAAHYTCGGVVTDLDGATSMPRLWACGEVACTGVHGANRLASNSLLEGLVFGARVAAAITAGKSTPDATGALRDIPDWSPSPAIPANPGPLIDGPSDQRPRAAAPADSITSAALRTQVAQAMTRHAGVMREAAGLFRARQVLDATPGRPGTAEGLDAAGWEVANLVEVGRAVVAAAQERRESRGAHHRVDFPETAPVAERIVHLGGERIRVPARTGAPVPAP